MSINVVILNTEDEILEKTINYNDEVITAAVIKRYNCQLFLRKKVLIEFGEFEYVGYYEYDADTRLYLFRACSKSRKKNKHAVAMGLLDVTRNLEIITGDLWVIRANLNTYKPEELSVEIWNEYRSSDSSSDNTSSSDADDVAVEGDEDYGGVAINSDEDSSDDDAVASDVLLSDDVSADDSDDTEEDSEDSDDELAMTKQFKKIQNHSKRGGSNNKKGHVSNEELQMMSQDNPIGGDDDDDDKSGDEDKSYGDGAEEDDILEEIFDEEPAKTPKKSKSSKNKSCITNLDTTLLSKVAKLSTILKPEDTLTTIEDLHDKRIKVVEILDTLDCSLDYARLIEMGVYNYSIAKCKIRELIPLWECNEFNEIYLTKAKSVYSNLNADCYVGNVTLLEKVKNGEIKPELVGLLPPSDVFPERWNHIIQENQHREKLIYESTMAKTTDKFVCPNSKCRGRKCVYVEAQIRSADEPMTIFITCLLCGKRFQQ
jgi:DNA-directed RNA polymerase subunit M/transcription elongation factor TFIIS